MRPTDRPSVCYRPRDNPDAMDSGYKGIRLPGGIGPPLSHASTSGVSRCMRRSMAIISYLSLW
jgi:hypothetical protein